MDVASRWRIILIVLCNLVAIATTKWVEGHLKTTENWSFLGRFCFLSMEGQFEYLIEFDPEMGFPNLLLYYDDPSQWPSVYHSNKSCKERENVLNKLGQNQIIPLSHWYPENDFSGCLLKSAEQEDANSSISPITPTKPTIERRGDNSTTSKVDIEKGASQSYFDKFLKTTADYSFFSTVDGNSTNWDGADYTTEGTLMPDATSADYEWETLSEETENNSSKNDNLKDVEYLFNGSVKGKGAQIRKRALLNTYERIQNRKFNRNVPRTYATYKSKEGEKRTLVVSCHNVRRFRSVRERWWFIAISNCGQSKGLNVKYKFLMTNGPPGDYWHEHFSADEFYVLPVLSAFCIAYALIIVAIVMCSVELKTRQLLHTTYKLFVVSVIFQELGIIMQCMAYMKYALNGVGLPSTKVIGQLFCGISEMTYLLLLILMGKGYTITRARLKVSFTIRLTIFICCYFVTYMFLFIYQAQAFDPGEVLYLYESPVGYSLIVLRILAWFMFIYAVLFTMKKYPEKSMFYCPFTVCGSLWFYAGPLFIITANNYIDKWVRESVVTAVLLFITFSGHITFLLLTLPVFANKNFPYHVRTTQIGVMEVIGTMSGSSNIDNFGHSVYEPNRNGHPQTVIIPLTRRTEELIGTMYGQYLASAPALSLEYIEATGPVANGRILNRATTPNERSINEGIPDPSTVSPSAPVLSTLNKEEVFSVDKEMDKMRLDNGQASNGDVSFLVNPPKPAEDGNNPFLISASVRARRQILEPLDRSAVAPPSWSLARGPAAKMSSRKKKRQNGVAVNGEGSVDKPSSAQNGTSACNTPSRSDRNGASHENGYVPVDLFTVSSTKTH